MLCLSLRWVAVESVLCCVVFVFVSCLCLCCVCVVVFVFGLCRVVSMRCYDCLA